MLCRTIAAFAALFLIASAGYAQEETVPEVRHLYLALGASDAVGFGAFPLENAYVYRIVGAIEAHRIKVFPLNPAIPAGLIDDVGRGADLVLDKGIRPELVTIWVGANDLIAGAEPDAFEAQLGAILQRLQAETDAVVCIGDLPDLTSIPRFVEEPLPTVTPQRVEAFNAAIARQAQAFGVILVELSAVPLVEEMVSDHDGFHPSNLGHGEIARHFLQQILPALGLR